MRLLSISEKDGRLRYFLTNLAYLVLVATPIEILLRNKSAVAALILIVPAVYLYISSAIRRCNDAEISSRFLFLLPIPVIGIIVSAYLLIASAGAGFSKKLFAYCAAAVAATFAIVVLIAVVVTKQDDAQLLTVPQAVQKPEIDFSYEQPASQAHPSVAFQQNEPSPVVFPPPNFDAGRQAELARQADDERRRRNREEEKERERFYAKQYAERDVVKCNLKPVMSDAEIQACSNR